MPHYCFLCMIISYARLRALSCILQMPSGTYLVCLECLSKSSALSKMGRLWALTFTPVIVMTFEFCQRGAPVDTPFLTILKTWTSPFEHPVIIHVCGRLEFPEVSATRLASGSPNSAVLCLVLAPNTCVFALKGGEWLVAYPHIPPAFPWHHRLFMGATGHGFLESMAGRHYIWPAGTLFCRGPLLLADVTSLHP